MGNDSTARMIIILVGVMFVTTVAGMVTLVIAGYEGVSLERIAGPLLTALVVTGVLGATTKQQNTRLDDQDKALNQITHQTNGVLDNRIREQTKAAAKEALRELAEEERQARVDELRSDG